MPTTPRRSIALGLAAIAVMAVGIATATFGWVQALHRQQQGERLYRAVAAGKLDAAYQAMKAGADPNQSPQGSLLLLALRASDFKMASYLKQAGADPTLALYFAETTEDVASLVDLGANPINARSPHGVDLVSTHALKGNVQVVQDLLARGAKPSNIYDLDRLLADLEQEKRESGGKGDPFAEIRAMIKLGR